MHDQVVAQHSMSFMTTKVKNHVSALAFVFPKASLEGLDCCLRISVGLLLGIESSTPASRVRERVSLFDRPSSSCTLSFARTALLVQCSPSNQEDWRQVQWSAVSGFLTQGRAWHRVLDRSFLRSQLVQGARGQGEVLP